MKIDRYNPYLNGVSFIRYSDLEKELEGKKLIGTCATCLFGDNTEADGDEIIVECLDNVGGNYNRWIMPWGCWHWEVKLNKNAIILKPYYL